MRAVLEAKKWSWLDALMIHKFYGITAITSFAMRAFPVTGNVWPAATFLA